MELRICHLYHDILDLYGDVGNIICMKKRLEWRGIDCTVTNLSLGQKLCEDDFDIIFIGSGREDEQMRVLADMQELKAAALRSAAEKGIVILAIGGGFELLGRDYRSLSGESFDFAGVLNMSVRAEKERSTGNYSFRCTEENGGFDIVAFENHAGRCFPDSELAPLGYVSSGSGNNGQDGSEGARYKNVFGSYGHGSLLPKNPGLCDLILKTALEHKYGSVTLAPLDDSIEQAAHDYMARRLAK